MKKNKNIILVHGAWHGPWCWEKIVPLLDAQGYKIRTPELSNTAETTLKSLVQELVVWLEFYDSPVILVGHSMAGVIISQVAEKIPEKIEKLIYVTAFIPEERGCLLDEAKKAKGPGLSAEMWLDDAHVFSYLKKSSETKRLLLSASSEEDATKSVERLTPQVFQPFRAHVNLSADRFGQVPKRYVVCMKDETLFAEDQLRMANRVGCEIVTLEGADHSPFYSAPEALVGAFL